MVDFPKVFYKKIWEETFIFKGFLFIVASRGIPTRGQGVKNVEIVVGTSLSFLFSEIDLEMRLGPHGQFDGICGLVMGFHTHKKGE
jgi:hypothetical protein